MTDGDAYIAHGDRVQHEHAGEGTVMGPDESNPRGVLVRWDDDQWTSAYVGELKIICPKRGCSMPCEFYGPGCP